MTAPIIEELGWRGIHIPPQARRARTTCPDCSPYRKKSDEPCLVVNVLSDGLAEVICHHCTPVWLEVRA